MYVLVFTICKPFGRRSHYHHWRVCVLHAVCIAPGAEAKRLLQGIQIREGPLSSILVCVCARARFRQEQDEDWEKNAEDILSGGKGETKVCVCVFNIIRVKPGEKGKGTLCVRVCELVCMVATGIQSSLIMNTLIWYSREEKDKPPYINGVYFPSPLFLSLSLLVGCLCYFSHSLLLPPHIFLFIPWWLRFTTYAYLLSLFTHVNYRWRWHQT